ncbi:MULTISPECIES: glycosyltransferase family 4 protein [unclassified Caballeronia]|uniref:glycosyltransferase family 4 protein n=1 Tax=unclassified Caballeronia TaxID=2646786 RepID=UPI00285A2E51|nr:MULTISPECIES: glycosyltransferase family 4 protein [unclassified Caballeronia]MDR5751971.1 glycosyltransferase family 4 protein [Caballeronia sp. LZ024]MDR5843888.1 glycosyltransferase family 4 protein [Caballeronia sp. LZ031]
MNRSASVRRVILSGGREVGGLQSFASNVGAGFDALGIPSEIIGRPSDMLRRWKDLRDPSVLKIFSTWAIFLCPLARNAIGVAHGFPRIDAQGILKFLAILSSFKIAQRSARLVAVSAYVQRHLAALFDIQCAATVHNPLPACWGATSSVQAPRNLITYVGRLHPVKRVSEFLPAVISALDADPNLEAMVIGSGECEAELKQQANRHPRVHFVASMNAREVIDVLARTKVFFSGCDTEAFGISLLEAAVSGCNLVTTGSGGFVEVILGAVNKTAFLLSPSFSDDECRAALDAALAAPGLHLAAAPFLPEAIARQYLTVAETREGGRS